MMLHTETFQQFGDVSNFVRRHHDRQPLTRIPSMSIEHDTIADLFELHKDLHLFVGLQVQSVQAVVIVAGSVNRLDVATIITRRSSVCRHYFNYRQNK